MSVVTTGKKVVYYDQEEQEMMEELDTLRESGVSPLVPDDAASHMQETVKAAHTYVRRKTISLRMLERDITKVKAIALRKGIPYQTYINMVLHDRIEQDFRKPASEIKL